VGSKTATAMTRQSNVAADVDGREKRMAKTATATINALIWI
jgi:hypothetical protein